jgi:hypothetical protein
MSTTEAEDYVSAPRNAYVWQAHASQSPTGRSSYTLPPTGGCWPKKLQPGARPRSGPNPTSTPPRAIAQEIEARGVRTPAGRDRRSPMQVSRLVSV